MSSDGKVESQLQQPPEDADIQIANYVKIDTTE